MQWEMYLRFKALGMAGFILQGIPVSLDKDEYLELEINNTYKSDGDKCDRDIREGDIVRHFKREWVSLETSEYLYKILAFAQHT